MPWAPPRSPDPVNISRHCLLTRTESLPAKFPLNFRKMINRRRPQVEITGRVIDQLQLSEQAVLGFTGYLLAGCVFQTKIPQPAVPKALNQWQYLSI
jgi:hypothetical protein